MFRKILAALGAALMVSACLPSGVGNAEEQMFDVVGEYTAGNNETPNEARRQALKDAIRQAAERAGVMVNSYSETHNFVLTKDEVSVVATSLVRVISEEYDVHMTTGGPLQATVKIVALVNTDNINNIGTKPEKPAKKEKVEKPKPATPKVEPKPIPVVPKPVLPTPKLEPNPSPQVQPITPPPTTFLATETARLRGSDEERARLDRDMAATREYIKGLYQIGGARRKRFYRHEIPGSSNWRSLMDEFLDHMGLEQYKPLTARSIARTRYRYNQLVFGDRELISSMSVMCAIMWSEARFMAGDFYHAYTVLNMAKSQSLGLSSNGSFYAEKIVVPDDMMADLNRYLSLLERWKIIGSTPEGWSEYHGDGGWSWTR